MVLLARTLCLQYTACSSRCRHSFLPRTSPISTQQKEEEHLTNASQHGIWRCQGRSLYVLHRVRRLLETSVLWADSVWQCSGPCISMCSVSRSSVSPGRGYRATRAIEFAVRLRRLLAGSYVSLGLSSSSSLSDFHISDTAQYVHIAESRPLHPTVAPFHRASQPSWMRCWRPIDKFRNTAQSRDQNGTTCVEAKRR